MTRIARALVFLPTLAALGCLAAPVSAPPVGGAPVVAAAPSVLVYYPAGDCTGELELELYDREAGAWRAHPEHPRLPPGACVREAPETLLNELRVRCADPAGERPPSGWVVGAELGAVGQPCVETPRR